MKKIKRMSLYWKCQLIGWSVASLYWGFYAFLGTNGFNFLMAMVYFIGDVAMYILLSHLFRNFSLRHQWHTLRPDKLLIRLVPAILLLGLLAMVLTVARIWPILSWTHPGVFTGKYVINLYMANFVTGLRLMSIWVLAYYGYHFVRREARAIIAAKDAQLNHLAAQLNPHFFFNSLNSIKALVNEDPPAARRAIDLLSDLMRTSLYKRDTALITVQEEMVLVNDYLELEKIRFEERLMVQIEVNDRLWKAKLLPFTIQPLIENAVKHSIAKLKEGGTILIKVEDRGEEMKITVAHPGEMGDENPDGLGIKNLQERLALQFSKKGKFHIGGYSDGTVMAVILIPLEYESDHY